jgi:hypothetical protein
VDFSVTHLPMEACQVDFSVTHLLMEAGQVDFLSLPNQVRLDADRSIFLSLTYQWMLARWNFLSLTYQWRLARKIQRREIHKKS